LLRSTIFAVNGFQMRSITGPKKLSDEATTPAGNSMITPPWRKCSIA